MVRMFDTGAEHDRSEIDSQVAALSKNPADGGVGEVFDVVELVLTECVEGFYVAIP